MSFSGEVKEELVKLENDARHCQIAELAVILVYAGAIKTDASGEVSIELQSDAPYVASRCGMLFERLFRTALPVGPNGSSLSLSKNDSRVIKKTLAAIKYKEGDRLVHPLVIKSLCCKRAFLRGAFLSVGSISNPQKGYHLEFVCSDAAQAEQLVETLLFYEIRAKIVLRKKYHVVYIKESEEIVELLDVIGAHAKCSQPASQLRDGKYHQDRQRSIQAD